MVNINCYKCDNKFDHNIDDGYFECPECGFGPEVCNHEFTESKSVVSYEDSNMIPDNGRRYIEEKYCYKCGQVKDS
jgi:hypothetical protein